MSKLNKADAIASEIYMLAMQISRVIESKAPIENLTILYDTLDVLIKDLQPTLTKK